MTKKFQLPSLGIKGNRKFKLVTKFLKHYRNNLDNNQKIWASITFFQSSNQWKLLIK